MDGWRNFGAMLADSATLTDCRNWQNPERLDRDRLNIESNAVAGGLKARGLPPGARVALLSANRWEFLAAFCGILRAGLQAVPINDKFPADTIDFILGDSNIRHIFADAAGKEILRHCNQDAGIPVTCFDDDGAFSGFQQAAGGDIADPGPDAVAMILYTSGSTGRPKGVPLSHAGHIWAMRKRAESASGAASHRLLVAAPLYHMNALCSALFALAAGADLVLLPRFQAKQYLQAIERFGCTWITSVPTMLAMVLQERTELARTDLSSVSIVRMGSAPVSQKLWDDVAAAFPGAGIMNGYGTTEAGPVVFGAAPGKKPPPLSAGFAHPEVDVKLIDAEGREADEGVLWHRTPATMTGYLNLPEKTAEVLTKDGWYISGDVFRRDAEGAYYFVGRSDDMFNCGGENIYPGEVEAVLESHPAIQQSCVLPVPDAIKGQKPVAFVVATPQSNVEEDDIKKFALARAPAYQHPRRVFFLDAMPLAGPGKIDRKGLQEEAERRWALPAQKLLEAEGGVA